MLDPLKHIQVTCIILWLKLPKAISEEISFYQAIISSLESKMFQSLDTQEIVNSSLVNKSASLELANLHLNGFSLLNYDVRFRRLCTKWSGFFSTKTTLDLSIEKQLNLKAGCRYFYLQYMTSNTHFQEKNSSKIWLKTHNLSSPTE